MFSGIKKFQKAKGLRVDGVMNPGGETERTIAKTLSGATNSILPRRKDKEEERRKKAEELEKKFPWPDKRTPRDWPAPDGSYPKPKPKPGIPDIMLPRLGQAVGIGGKNKASDVAAAKALLKQAGFLSNPKTAESEADPDFQFDIQRFQTANGLKMDGVMNPGGETEKKLADTKTTQDSSDEEEEPVIDEEDGSYSDECVALNENLKAAEYKKEVLIQGAQSLKTELRSNLVSAKNAVKNEAAKLAIEGGMSALDLLEEVGVALWKAARKVIESIIKALLLMELLDLVSSYLYPIKEKIDNVLKDMDAVDLEIATIKSSMSKISCPVISDS